MKWQSWYRIMRFLPMHPMVLKNKANISQASKSDEAGLAFDQIFIQLQCSYSTIPSASLHLTLEQEGYCRTTSLPPLNWLQLEKGLLFNSPESQKRCSFFLSGGHRLVGMSDLYQIQAWTLLTTRCVSCLPTKVSCILGKIAALHLHVCSHSVDVVW